MLVLALKVVLAPALVTGATLAGRRWGAVVAGALTAVPIVAGPILLILTLDHGRAFGADAARAALLGLVALTAFCVVFARAAGRGWPVALVAGWLAYLAVAAPLAAVEAPAGIGLAAALVALVVAYAAIGDPGVHVPRVHPPPAWDLPARAGMTAALVVALTAAAGALGPALSGVLTPFPVATTVIAAFTLQQDGAVAARALLRGFVRALPGFALTFFAVALLL